MTYTIPTSPIAPLCSQGFCVNHVAPMTATWLLPQQVPATGINPTVGAKPFHRVTWNYVLVCDFHAELWWDGDEPPAGLPHYRLVEAPVVDHSPQWPIEEQA
jgi:hypothetical protein